MSDRLLHCRVTRRDVLAIGSGLLGALVLSPGGRHASAAATGQAAATPTNAPRFFMKGGTVGPDVHPNTVALAKWGQLIEQGTGGAIKSDIYANAQIGTEVDLFEGMINNTVQFAPVNVAVAANWVPEGSILDLPYLFRSPDHAYKVYMGDFGKSLAERYPKVGVRVLGFWVNGIRHMYGNVDLRTPDQVRGKKARTLASPIHVAMWTALGASPQAIGTSSDTYLALKQGVVQVADNSVTTWWQAKLCEAGKSMALTGHVYSIALLGVSEKFWQGLPADFQQVIAKTVPEIVQFQNRLTFETDDTSITQAVKAGYTVERNPDIAAWKSKLQPVWDQFKDKVGGSRAIQQVVDTK